MKAKKKTIFLFLNSDSETLELNELSYDKVDYIAKLDSNNS